MDRRLTPLIALALLLALPAPLAAEPACERVVAIGDLHGDAERFRATLEAAGLVDDALSWTGGAACLVQLGDLFDRGSAWPEIVTTLKALERQAPGQVHVLLGNHEAMNLLGDWRYVPEEDIASYAPDETRTERDVAFASWARARDARGVEATRDLFDESFPPGWFARLRDLSPEGETGAWLLERPLLLRVGTTLFVHGGVTLEHAELGIETVNERAALELRAWLRFRDYLVERGILDPFLDYHATIDALGAWLVPKRNDPEAWSALDDDLRRAAVGLAVLEQGLPLAPEGPLWNRSLAVEEGQEGVGELTTLLFRFGVRRLVVGHSPRKSGRVETRFDRRVFLIDTSAGPRGGEGLSALVLERNGARALSAQGMKTLVQSDEDVENWLSSARIVEVRAAPAGITKPYVVDLEHEGREYRALFKYIDEKKTGPSRERHFDLELVFTDSYKHELAAYRLDRYLGLNLLPVAVARDVEGRRGALVEWVEGAMSEKERLDARLFPEEPMVLLEQRESMRVFDALILNTDRTLENQLTRPRDWRLVPIDHSRSFRLSLKLPPGFAERPVRLTRSLHDKLVGLEEGPLRDLLGDYLTRQQIRSLLKRRDRLISQVRRDLREHGESFVFLDGGAREGG